MVKHCDLHGDQLEKMVPQLQEVSIDGTDALIPVMVCPFMGCDLMSYPDSTWDIGEWVSASRLLG